MFRLFITSVFRNTSKYLIILPLTDKAGEIMTSITNEGYQVTAMEMFHMEKANAEEFFEVYKGVVAEYIVSITLLR